MIFFTFGNFSALAPGPIPASVLELNDDSGAQLVEASNGPRRQKVSMDALGARRNFCSSRPASFIDRSLTLRTCQSAALVAARLIEQRGLEFGFPIRRGVSVAFF